MKPFRPIGAAMRALPRLLIQRPALATLGLGLFATLVVAGVTRELEQRRIDAVFERRAAARIAAVHDGLDDAVETLATVNRLFAALPEVGRAQFAGFALPVLTRNPQLGLLAYQRLVNDTGRAAFEAERQRQWPGFAITELAAGKPVRAAPRASYRVVDYLAPMDGNRDVFGFDAATRREQDGAARQACASGAVAMTGQYSVLLGGRMQPGFLLMAPVYSGPAGAPPCARVVGYTVAVVGSQALAAHALGSARLPAAPDLEISVYQGSTAGPATRVFHQDAARGARPSALAALFGGGTRHAAASFEVAGRAWHVAVTGRPNRLLPDSVGSLLMFAGGALGSLLAAVCIGALAARERGVRRLVRERTGTLQLLRQAIEACADGIVITCAEGTDCRIEYVNPAFERITGYRAAEVIRRGATMLWDIAAGEEGVQELRALVRTREEGSALVRARRKDGSELWTEVHVAPFRDASGAVSHLVITHYDVTEKRRYEAELQHQATHDALTGLANRKLLDQRLRQEVAAAARHKHVLWVLFVDLDRFKFVNDSLGHRAGDACLRAIAQRLVAAVRPEDTVARVGGDEFVLVLPGRGEGPPDPALVERIMSAIDHPVMVDGQEFFLSGSVGIACYPDDGDDPDTLVEFADLAMYRAKQLGRNSYQFYQPQLNQQAQERRQLEQALRHALERDQFELYYQPQLDLRSGRLVGVEALLRWRHPELGLLAPPQFLTLAEDTGLSVAIGAWSMRSACAQLRRWQQDGHAGLRLALNLASRQFHQADLLEQVTAILDDTGLEPRYLELELTERMVMSDVARAVDVLASLRALGVSVAVDDFGTSYSSLAQLKRFPLDALKIDQSFVRAISEERHDGAIPNAIISLAHNLGMRVVAEGVDTEAQCEFLAHNMCDEMQGPLFAPPLDAAGLAALLAEGRALAPHLLRLYKPERTLLLVDDEPNILAALRRQLRGAGLRILTAPGGREGLALLDNEHVDVIVSDQRMPGMTGVEFLRVVKKSHPDTVRMVLSGFTELQSVTDAVNEGAIYKFLTKPWDDTQLRAHILEAFKLKEMADENRRLDLEVRTANHGLALANRQLEEMLQQQREQISRTGISLDIVREALHHVPLPIIGLDEEQVVAFTNTAAQELFGHAGLVLGSPVEWFMPALAAVCDGSSEVETVQGMRFEIVARSMGKGTRARGRLIIFKPAPEVAATDKEA